MFREEAQECLTLKTSNLPVSGLMSLFSKMDVDENKKKQKQTLSMRTASTLDDKHHQDKKKNHNINARGCT